MTTPSLDELASATEAVTSALKDLSTARSGFAEAQTRLTDAGSRARLAMEAANMDADLVIPSTDAVGRMSAVVNEMYDLLVEHELEASAAPPFGTDERLAFIEDVLPVFCDISYRLAYNKFEDLDAKLVAATAYQFDAVLARLTEVRAYGVAIEDGRQEKRTEIGKAWGISGSRVGKLIEDEFLEEPVGDPEVELAPDPRFDRLGLSKDELLTVSWAVLLLMNRDIAARAEPDRRLEHARFLYRKMLNEKFETPLPTLGDFEVVLRDRLGSVSSAPRSVVALVEISASNPWGTLKEPVDAVERLKTLNWVADMLTGTIVRSDVGLIDEALRKSFDPKSAYIKRWAVPITVATVAALVTGGVGALAAPAIGGAIGGVMGLSGAAATSAGLAWLGGGALATGGLGMAGGTALLTGAGALFGIPAGAAASRRVPKNVVKAEAAKLYATSWTLKHKAGDSTEMREAYDLCVTGIHGQLAELESKSGIYSGSKTKADVLGKILDDLGEQR